jgi:hypothetical protein
MQHHEEEELDPKRIALRTDLQNVRIPLEGVVVDVWTYARLCSMNKWIGMHGTHGNRDSRSAQAVR